MKNLLIVLLYLAVTVIGSAHATTLLFKPGWRLTDSSSLIDTPVLLLMMGPLLMLCILLLAKKSAAKN